MSKPKKEAATASAATDSATTTKPAKITQNGVSRPGAGTQTERIWVISDELSAKLGAPVDRKEVLDAAVSEKINVATAATQYGKWRVFNGLGKPAKTAVPAAATTDANAAAVV